MNTMELVPAFLLAGVVTSLLVLLVRGDKAHERIMGLPKRTVATREVLPAPLLRPYSHVSPHTSQHSQIILQAPIEGRLLRPEAKRLRVFALLPDTGESGEAYDVEMEVN